MNDHNSYNISSEPKLGKAMFNFTAVSEPVVPYHDLNLPKKEQVGLMFDRIAFRYDLMNRLLSFGIDGLWRRMMVKTVRAFHPEMILDVATGTAEVAILLATHGMKKITGIDLSNEMLERGRIKILNKKLQSKITLQHADSENLPFEDNKFDSATVAFGVRNFEHLENGLKEIYRVLKPGGRFVILEFSKPKSFPFKYLYQFYFKRVCPLIGKWITRDHEAYSYLYRSVESFPEGEAFIQILKRTGFYHIQCKSLSFGISSLYVAGKP